jgi:rubrerythrin
MATIDTARLDDLAALTAFDADGALRETMASTKATSNDVSILNFALTLEYLETAFYEEAVRKGALDGETLKFAKIARNHERGHVNLLEGALGSAAVKRPRFDFKGTTENARTFRATAIVLEDTGVQAYAGQAGLLDDPAILTTAVRIHSIEAGHAAWVRHIVGKEPAPRAFDEPLTRAQVLAAVRKTGFIVG